jgi:HAD superfamily hydrolase (TIGR01509 family)
MIQGIIFDLDGVLIDSSVCHRDAFLTVFAPFGITDFNYSNYAGRRTPDVVEEVFRRAGIGADGELIARTAKEKSRLARECLSARAPLAEGCPEILQELAGHYALALATSGSRSSLDIFLEMARCRQLFRSILSGEDVTHAKPDPEIYRRSFETLGIPSSRCLVVEDAVAGVEAARAAGATVAGLVGTCPGESLHQAGAAHIIQKLPELTGLLAAL